LNYRDDLVSKRMGRGDMLRVSEVASKKEETTSEIYSSDGRTIIEKWSVGHKVGSIVSDKMYYRVL